MIRSMLARYWWVWLVRGLLLSVFGLAILVNPAAGVAGIAAFLAAWWLVSGVFGVVGSVQARHEHGDWWLMLVSGVSGIVLGVVTFAWPGLSMLVLTVLVGFYAFIGGAGEIWTGLRLRKEIPQEGWLILSGALAMIFGVLMLWRPWAGTVALTLLVGTYAFVVGIALTIGAFRVRKFAHGP